MLTLTKLVYLKKGYFILIVWSDYTYFSFREKTISLLSNTSTNNTIFFQESLQVIFSNNVFSNEGQSSHIIEWDVALHGPTVSVQDKKMLFIN